MKGDLTMDDISSYYPKRLQYYFNNSNKIMHSDIAKHLRSTRRIVENKSSNNLNVEYIYKIDKFYSKIISNNINSFYGLLIERNNLGNNYYTKMIIIWRLEKIWKSSRYKAFIEKRGTFK